MIMMMIMIMLMMLLIMLLLDDDADDDVFYQQLQAVAGVVLCNVFPFWVACCVVFSGCMGSEFILLLFFWYVSFWLVFFYFFAFYFRLPFVHWPKGILTISGTLFHVG